jgi:low temperature requirement protein LtrA
VHVILVAGVIVSAAADDYVILHPPQRIDWPTAWLLLGGPAIYIAGNGLYKRVVYGWFPLSHWVGLALLALIAPFAFHTDLLMTGGLTTLVMIVVATWESVSRRRSPQTGQMEEEPLGAE